MSNENSYKRVITHDQDGHQALIWYKYSSPEPTNGFPCNLVCIIRYDSTTEIHKSCPLIDLDPFLHRGQIKSLGLCIEVNLCTFGNNCSLRSQSWLKHSTQLVNENK